jgi:hypothetical protein
MLSRFLPADLDRARPIAVIAGNGDYPAMTIAAIRRAGLAARLIGVNGDVRDDLVASFIESERRVIDVGQIGKLLTTLREFGCAHAIMAGQVTPKRLFHGLNPDFKAAAILLKLKRKNAESIFGAIADEMSAIGVTLLDARAFLEDQLADAGWMTKRTEKIDEEYLQHGLEIARECARLGIGQGVVVRKGTVLAVEAFEGTDDMLRRAGTFKTDGMIFVKTVKPRQDFRFDVPVFGRRTLDIMHDSKITTAALGAGDVLLLDRPAVLKQAEASGIQIFGFGPPSNRTQ